ncbi:hypothetical protein NUU61_006095 [Penicillium alfredii]|uniref:Uncharacterized protein n=1 Tax=Penicillium alfredii TaxID=1506179 RepID=A0A9W9F0F3_9EURO|nr:uncharacterized protein NUU61_006095 [Penicillium alfredii]KAJ5091225.1 hypothetical protein NUU61_006095 [Penicillium alfredii]
MAYSGLPLFPPIPASIRRRILHLYSSHRAAPKSHESSRDPRRGLVASSEPHLLCHDQTWAPATPEARPATASGDWDSFDSSASGISDSPRLDGAGCPVNYETQSGLRWNRVVPAFNLLRNAGFEAQQPHADGTLARSLYLNALVYLLEALPSDLTPEETSLLQHHIPDSVRTSPASCPQPDSEHVDPATSSHSQLPARSYLHRLLACMIVQFCLLVRFLLPFARLLLRRLYEYERSHRITERIVTATLDTADGLGKSSAQIGSTVLNMNEGRVGTAVSSAAAWWIEGVAGGIYEGVGEGMLHLGLLGPGLELNQVSMQTSRRH